MYVSDFATYVYNLNVYKLQSAIILSVYLQIFLNYYNSKKQLYVFYWF